MSALENLVKPLMRHRVSELVALEHAATDFPWTLKMYEDSLDADYWGGVLCRGQQLLGAAVVSSGAGESHLLNMFIAIEQQGQGLGRLLLTTACQHARHVDAAKMFLEVRAGNGRAITLYESVGFRQIGVRKDYYPGLLGREDAVCMALNLMQAGV